MMRSAFAAMGRSDHTDGILICHSKGSPVKKTDFIPAALVVLLATSGAWGADDTAVIDANARIASTGIGTAVTESSSANVWNGTVVETMNSAGYTYVLLDTGSDKIWVVATETAVKVGERVSVPRGMVMKDFVSKTLNRSFDEIYFVEGIYPEGAAPKAGGLVQDTSSNSRTVVADAHVKPLAKVEGGYTVKEILARSATLRGKNVKVRGRVVKFVPHIMGTNWMHIQDGTGADLTVTTNDSFAKGDQVIVEGVLSVNKDFGAGYVYPAIIEKATVTKE